MSPNTSPSAVLGQHQSLAVIGAAWGDEGKGKIVDFLAPSFDAVVRFSGGRNAGHTIWLPDGRKVVCHLLPSGVASGRTSVLARGVLFDPFGFVEEFDEVESIVGTPDVWIDPQCTVWTPWHTMLETWVERCLSHCNHQQNTTKRGILSLAGLQAMRCDIKVSDLLGDREALLKKLHALWEILLPILDGMAEPEPSPSEVLESLERLAPRIRDHVQDTSFLLWKMLREGRRVLFEGAQATMLDLLHGTNPFVSSGMSISAGAAYGTGLPPDAIKATLLVAKAYPTRVGAGPMVSEIWNREGAEKFPKQHPELFEPGAVRDRFLASMLSLINDGRASRAEESQYWQVLMVELGATTGRGRSVGYPDLPIMRYAQRINGANYLALTKLDKLTGVKEIPVVMNYQRPNGATVRSGEMPLTEELERTRPLIQRKRGWWTDISGCVNYQSLPREARGLAELFEEESCMRVLIIGTGADRNSTIVRG